MPSKPPPVDFDAVLRALGAEDAEPPPLMRKLLSELPDSASPSTAGASRADARLLADLEAWLQALERERAHRESRI
jgi:hypothetical protein